MLKRPRKSDPSGTLWISNKFFQEFKRRFNALKKDIKQKMLFEPSFVTNAYDFPLDPRYLDEFSGWLSEKTEEHLLHIMPGPGIHARYDRWSDQYVMPAYKQGMYNAYMHGGFGAVAGAAANPWVQASFSMPFHVSRVGLLYLRTYESLKNVSEATAGAIRAELAQGMVEGINPRKIASRMADKIDDIGIHRAELIARTEIMRAHSEASLDTYESFETEGITLLVEYLYTKDDRVCQKCIDFGTDENGNPKRFKVSESHGILPLHPNCRCVWIPWVPGLDSEKDQKTEEGIDF